MAFTEYIKASYSPIFKLMPCTLLKHVADANDTSGIDILKNLLTAS